jgi:hypothetical protein
MNTNKATYHLIQQPTSLKCIQINLRHCSAASTVLETTILEEGVDIALIQEPYARFNATQQNIFVPNIPRGYKCHHKLNNHDHAYGYGYGYGYSISIARFPTECSNDAG